MLRVRSSVALVLVALTLAAGCGRSDGPTSDRARGTPTADHPVNLSPDAVIRAFRRHGLEAEPARMQYAVEDGPLPAYPIKSETFTVPSLGREPTGVVRDRGGSVEQFASIADRKRWVRHWTSVERRHHEPIPWRLVHGSLVVQIHPSMSRAEAQKYALVLRGLP